MSTRVLPLLALAALGGCGGGDPPGAGGANEYMLSGATPFPASFAMGDRVRNVILRAESRVNGDARVTRCGYSLVLFDAAQASTIAPIQRDTSGDCALYRTAPEEQYLSQRAVCLGALDVRSGAIMENRVFCPMPGGPTTGANGEFTGCGNFFSQRTATVSSIDDGVTGDAVTDLAGTVSFPTAVAITAPTDLAVFTWPASGDLTVRWTSAMATSAMVRLEPDGSTMGPVIICAPRINGSMRVESRLIEMAGFRAMNVRVRVWSYRETRVTAKSNVAWRLTGAVGTSLLLQPGR